MTFDRTTKKAVLAEIVQDYAELGRLMGCPTYATAAGLQSLYPA